MVVVEKMHTNNIHCRRQFKARQTQSERERDRERKRREREIDMVDGRAKTGRKLARPLPCFSLSYIYHCVACIK